MSEEIKTYSPPTEEQKPLPVNADTTGFEEVLDSTGIINTKLNEKVIIQRIAKDLYKNASSGLRELYNNSARACRIAVSKHGEKYPLIRVTMNQKNRTLIIEDNGLGISKERFKKVLLELGTSDNLDKGEVGQFGMGFASYTTLSSVIIIDTRARNEDQYKMVAKDGMSFQPVGNASIKGYGTRLEMTCYDKVDFEELLHRLVSIAKYSAVPTILELNDFDYYPRGFGAGANKIEQSSFDDDVKANADSKIDVVEIDNDDFRFIGFASGISIRPNDNHVHLLNTPIESDIKVPFNWWVLNIKDERKFMPMPDRDRMREESDRVLTSMLQKELKKYFSDLIIRSYQEFLDSPRQNEFLWLGRNIEYAPHVIESTLLQLQACWVRDVLYDTKSFYDHSLLVKLADNPHLVYQGFNNRKISAKVMQFKPDHKLITVKKTKKHPWKADVEFMEKWGIPNARQILLDNKVKIPKAEKSEFELIGHTHADYYEHGVVPLDDIDENVLRVDSMPINKVLRYVKAYKNPYTIVRNAPELEDYDSRDFSEWLKSDVPNIVCPTTRGAMTIKEIVDSGEEFVFCEDFEVEYEYFFKDEKRIIIYGSNQLLPMALYLNPECECKETGTYVMKPVNDFKHQDFDVFVAEKYGVSLSSDYDKKFFCSNMKKVHPCFHTLFGSLLKNTGWDVKDDLKAHLFKDYLEVCVGYKPFDMDDDIAALRFYYGEHAKMADRESNIAETLHMLLDRVKRKIVANEYLMARLVKEVLMPKVFGHIEFRSMKKETLSYQDGAYEVNLATHDTEFSFKDDMECYDFTLQFRGVKMKINKGYCSIKVLVFINS